MNDTRVSQKNSSGGAMSLVAIMCLGAVGMGFSVVTPAMEVLGNHYQGLNVTWISTLPTLFVVFGTSAAGPLMGKRVKYKTLAIVSTLICLIGGCAPALFGDYVFMLVCRAVFGFGLGLLIPLATALIMGNYEGDKRSRYLGWSTLFMNAGGIIFQTLGGILADMNWQLTFWGHLLFILPFITSFFLHEPIPAAEPEDVGAAPVKEKMSGKVWILAIILAVFQVFSYPVMLNISVIFVERAIGTAAIASTALSMYTVAGCVAGLIFGWVFKATRRVTIGLGYLLCAVGALLVYLDIPTYIVPTVGCMMLGFGFSTILPAMFEWLGVITPPSTVPGGTSVIMAVMYVGSFCSSFWLTANDIMFGDSTYMPILIESIAFFIFAVIFFIYNPFKKAQNA